MFAPLNLKVVATCYLSTLSLLAADVAMTGGMRRVPQPDVAGEESLRFDFPVKQREAWTLDEILRAMRAVESGGAADEGRDAVGDCGEALGPFQIHHAYWEDAAMPGAYEDCRDPQYARNVVVAYWKRYCPRALESLDAEVLARVHNGGPRGHEQARTCAYWDKVERELVSRRQQSVEEGVLRVPPRYTRVPSSMIGATGSTRLLFPRGPTT